MRVFQRYFACMARAVKEFPVAVANELYSKRLIADETLERVQSTLALTPHEKATILLLAVKAKIDESRGDKVLKKVCDVLGKTTNLKELPKRMMAKYGKFY